MSINAGSGTIKKVLIVEDLVEIAELTGEALSQRGFHVEIAEGRAGKSKAEQWGPDLVVADYRMPDLDGLQLLNYLKEKNSFRPLVFLATADIGFEYQLAYGMGAEAVLLKPFGMDSLLETIDRFSRPSCEFWSVSPGPLEINVSWSAEISKELGFFRSLAMGRGGMIIKADFIPGLNDRIAFSIDIKHSDISKIEGTGKVRWVTDHWEGVSNVGLEFEYIEGNSRKELLKLINTSSDLRPYIPFSR